MLRNSVALVLLIHLLGKSVEAGWRQEGLKAHNELRAAHGASPLVLDGKVKNKTHFQSMHKTIEFFPVLKKPKDTNCTSLLINSTLLVEPRGAGLC